MWIKAIIRKYLPQRWLSFYHKTLALTADFVYGHPSRKMVVVGITGTKGKSTTANILWQILTDVGYKVGLTSTVNYRIGKECNLLSTYKMTMVGRFKLQSWLKRMKQAGCEFAIVETTSEGIKQWRHFGINYDICILTNLTPEHLEAHGGFENYKQAKLELFRHLAKLPAKYLDFPVCLTQQHLFSRKAAAVKIQNPKSKNQNDPLRSRFSEASNEKLKIRTKEQVVPRGSVVNADQEYGEEFLEIGNWQKVTVGGKDEVTLEISEVKEYLDKTTFKINGKDGQIPLPGHWNVNNAVLAMGVGIIFKIPLEEMLGELKKIEPIPGRMESINEGQMFKVIVDYAHEPQSLKLLYEFFIHHKEEQTRLITLISSTGGGRDVGRRAVNGRIAGRYCDLVIVTDEDPYDDDPQKIIDEVAEGVKEMGKVEGQNFWRILDRREAIKKAFSLAQTGDIVFLTAKGAEQKMCVKGGKKIDWDDRKIAREILKNFN